MNSNEITINDNENNLFIQIDNLLAKAYQHNNYLQIIQQDVINNNNAISVKETMLKKLNHNHNIFETSKNYLENLIKQQSEKYINEINDILNYGMKTIFDDCLYIIKIQVDNEKAKLNIYLNYKDDEDNEISVDIQQCGGGIRTIIGVLLQIYFIVQYQVEPILFVDEGFSQVSSQYLPNLFKVIQEVAKNNGLKLLLVTHDNRILSYANERYEIQNGFIINEPDISA